VNASRAILRRRKRASEGSTFSLRATFRLACRSPRSSRTSDLRLVITASSSRTEKIFWQLRRLWPGATAVLVLADGYLQGISLTMLVPNFSILASQTGGLCYPHTRLRSPGRVNV
jgi:hypothetical protein